MANKLVPVLGFKQLGQKNKNIQLAPALDYMQLVPDCTQWGQKRKNSSIFLLRM